MHYIFTAFKTARVVVPLRAEATQFPYSRIFLMTNILIVEDDTLTRECLIDLLEAENFQVTVAIDGDIAQKLVNQKNFDVIVCELLLPHIHGYEFLSYLRNNKKTADIPFIVLTGKNNTKDINLGQEMGVDDYIVKPFLNLELIQSIKTQLEKKLFLEECYRTEIQKLDITFKELRLTSNLSNPDNLSLNQDIQASLVYQSILIDKQYKLLNKYINERVELYSENSSTNSSIAVCCLRLDSLEKFPVNSTKWSSEIIKTAAQRLLGSIGRQANIKCLRNGDFSIVLPYIKNLRQALKVARTAQNSLLQPLIIDSNIISLKSHVGISFYPERFQDIQILLNRAKELVKEAIKNQHDYYEVYYSDILPTLDLKSLVLLEELQDALSKDLLSANYQPQIDLLTGKVVGYEALLRWHNPRKGMIPPDKFMTIAEDASLIESIETKFMLDECKKLKKFHKKGFDQLQLTINISTNQFSQDYFVAIVKKILADVQLEAQFLKISLTVSTLLKDKKKSFAHLSELKSLGVGIILESYKSNSSSLNYLKQFPFTILKFDISYLNSLLKISNNHKFWQYIITIAKRFELQLIIKGIENLQQLNILRQNHVATAQGNFLAPPLEIDELEYLLSGKSEWLNTIFSFPPI